MIIGITELNVLFVLGHACQRHAQTLFEQLVQETDGCWLDDEIPSPPATAAILFCDEG